MATGWKLVENVWYYFNGSGYLLKGEQTIAGTKWSVSYTHLVKQVQKFETDRLKIAKAIEKGIGIKAIKPENLNTSHVLIYRNCKMSGVWQNKFKYISCSYLSLAVAVSYTHLDVYKRQRLRLNTLF